MKQLLFILSFALILNPLYAQNQNEAEKNAIKKLIKESYVEAMFNTGDAEAVQNGWHKDCDIVILNPRDGKVIKYPASRWVEHFKKAKKGLDPGTTCKFGDILLEGTAAVATVYVYNSKGKQIYTDFMSLYKLSSGWKIVTKIYYDHH